MCNMVIIKPYNQSEDHYTMITYDGFLMNIIKLFQTLHVGQVYVCVVTRNKTILRNYFFGENAKRI